MTPPVGHLDSQGPPAMVLRPLVLVADDSADLREILADVLSDIGYEVQTVASGGRALSEMTRRTPDLVITDLFMPGMSGFTLRSQMLRRPELARVPVIVLSAYWHRPSETLEVADVLTKPMNLDRLVESVRRLCPAPSMQDEMSMSDQPVREPMPADPTRDRSDVVAPGDAPGEDRPPIRPSAAEGGEETGGRRPPRPSQAEGERDTDD